MSKEIVNCFCEHNFVFLEFDQDLSVFETEGFDHRFGKTDSVALPVRVRSYFLNVADRAKNH